MSPTFPPSAHKTRLPCTAYSYTLQTPTTTQTNRTTTPNQLFGSADATTTATLAAESTESVEWYTTTGQALITTIAINVVAPRLPDAVEHFILGPWRRRSAAASSVITQRQLNRNWKGERRRRGMVV